MAEAAPRCPHCKEPMTRRAEFDRTPGTGTPPVLAWACDNAGCSVHGFLLYRPTALRTG